MIVVLALGANRRRAVVEDAARAVAEGLAPVVVVDKIGAWRGDPLPDGARVVELSTVELRHRPRRWMNTALVRVPIAGLKRLGKGGKRAAGAYDRRIAGPAQQRVLLPLYRRIWPDQAAKIMTEQVLGGVAPDAVIATDPASIAFAAAMMRNIHNITSVRVAFGLTYAGLVSDSDAG